MRSPSTRTTPNTVDIYKAIQGRRGTGTEYTYPDLPDYGSIPCSVQPRKRMINADELARLSQVNVYDVFFTADYDIDVRDKLVWTNSLGDQRTLMAETSYDDTGHGRVFVVRCTEIV